MSFESVAILQNKAAVIASLKTVEGDVQGEVVRQFKEGGERVRESLRASIPDAPGEDVHSSPGGVPYSQTGTLRSKIQATVLPLMLNEPVTLKIHVTQKGFYGRMLEFGTSRIAARPWFFSGVKNMFPFLVDHVDRALSEVTARRKARSA